MTKVQTYCFLRDVEWFNETDHFTKPKVPVYSISYSYIAVVKFDKLKLRSTLADGNKIQRAHQTRIAITYGERRLL